MSERGGQLHLPAAAGLERAAGRAGVLLDRVDDVLVPAVARVVGDGLDRAGSASKVFATRFRNRTGASAPATGQSGHGAAGPRALAALRNSGHLARGARLGVSVAVAAIVVSAAAATFQGQDRLGFPHPPALPPGADPGVAAAVGGDGGGVAAPEVSIPEVEVTVGPYPGDEVGSYLADARSRLDELVLAAPDADLFAVVSFTGYRTPAELLALLSDYRMHRVFIRMPPDGEVLEAQVRDPVADVDAAFAHAADATARRMASATDPQAHARAGQEASAYGGRCSCVFSAVVRAPAGRLAELAGTDGVRLVDVASPGATMAGSVFVPLLPERR